MDKDTETLYSITKKLQEMSEARHLAHLKNPKDSPIGDIVSCLFSHFADILWDVGLWEKSRMSADVEGAFVTRENMANIVKTLLYAQVFIKGLIKKGDDSANCIGAKNVVDHIEAALYSQVRNCDRFGGDPERLHDEWFEWTGTEAGTNPDGTVKMTFADWLLATWDGTEMFPKKAPMKGDR